MPGDSKKNDKKNAKEQRKPRQRHQQQAKTDIKPEKPEELMNTPNVTVLQKPPVYESPPPEFYKNLKRETDEVLKITEEENSKYKKKEIQSNWSKYEMPIETYDEIDEQENLGADYEKLIEAPLSVGGHFQFKHERSWDMNIGPSQYDKYFEINMEDLNVALCTIPFYERNYIKQNEFNESDILSMNNRCTRFKQKYFNDKSYASPESEVQDKILNSLQDSNNKNNEIEDTEKYSKDIVINMENENSDIVTIKAENNLEVTRDPVTDSNNTIEKLTMKMTQEADYSKKAEETSALDDIVNDDFIFRNTEKTIRSEHSEPTNMISDIVPQVTVKETPLVNRTADIVESKVPVIDGSKVAASVETKVTKAVFAVSQSPVDTKKNPVIESPEDLEKWLDDFLDG